MNESVVWRLRTTGEQGLPVITNGLSRCKIHHTAFDKYIIGITPDYTIKVRKDILEEIDGPMFLVDSYI